MSIVLSVKNTEKLKIYKTLVISIICGKCGNKRQRIFIKEESIEILKILGFISIICGKCGNKCKIIFIKEESIEILKILGLIYNYGEKKSKLWL